MANRNSKYKKKKRNDKYMFLNLLSNNTTKLCDVHRRSNVETQTTAYSILLRIVVKSEYDYD